MTATIAPAPPALPPAAPTTDAPPTATTGTAPTAPATPTGATQDALAATLAQLITALQGIIAALTGAGQLGATTVAAGGPGQSPVQSPGQSPIQSPGQAAAGAPAAPVAPIGGGATTTAPAASGGIQGVLTPVSAGYRGPDVGIDPIGNQSTYVFHSGIDGGASTGNLQIFGRFGTDPTSSLGKNTVYVSGSAAGPGGGSRVAIPDSGSLSLASGATFAWSGQARTSRAGMPYTELSFTITRPGAATQVISAADDRFNGYNDKLVSPLTAAETVELTSLFATRFPVVPR